MFAVISAEQISSLMLRHSSAGEGDWGEAGLGHKYQCVRLSAGFCVIFVVLFSRFRENSTPLNAAVLRRSLSAAALNTVTNILDSGGNQA